MITIRQAQPADAGTIAPLFDAYRQFYGKPADPDTAARFVAERLAKNESTIFLATGAGGDAAGFVQLYPTFSSVSAARTYILNDLFVAPHARGGAVARGLIDAAASFAREQGAIRLTLSTAKTNGAAQALYESGGWIRDEQYYGYSLSL